MESARSDALFHDPLAGGLAGERGLRIARSRPDGAWVVAIRTVLIDAFLRSAIVSGIDTVINLGAGLDTRPYRMDLPSARPDYHVNSSRHAHHASAASIALSASGTLSKIQAVATQCREIWVIIAGRNRRSSGVTGSGAELS